MIVTPSSSTCGRVLCGRDGSVGLLYDKSSFGSRLVNTEILHVFQQTPSQLYGVIPVLFGMLAH